MRRPKPKFNLDSELIALNVQGFGSQDIVFPIDRKYSNEEKTWIYECELIVNYLIPLELQDSLPYPPDSIVFVKECHLTTQTEDDF